MKVKYDSKIDVIYIDLSSGKYENTNKNCRFYFRRFD